MPITKYTKWMVRSLDGLNLEDLLDEMSEFFLQSGFPNDPWGDPDTDVRQSLPTGDRREACGDGTYPAGDA